MANDSEQIVCRLIRFNPRRAARGVGAAEVELNGEVLWMTRRDIDLNIRDWGELPGLLHAKDAYKANVDFREGESV